MLGQPTAIPAETLSYICGSRWGAWSELISRDSCKAPYGRRKKYRNLSRFRIFSQFSAHFEVRPKFSPTWDFGFFICFVFFQNGIQVFSKRWMCKHHGFYCVERMSPKKMEIQKRGTSEEEPFKNHDKNVSKKWCKINRKTIQKSLKHEAQFH